MRQGGPNKPYVVDGWSLTPEIGDPEIIDTGIATWYGRKFHGRLTASGELYNLYAMTAAHRTMPIPSYARVINPANGREVIVRINDRGPFVKGRVIDLSWAAAVKLDLHRNAAAVRVERITHEQIRSGDVSARGGLARSPADIEAPVPPVPRRQDAPLPVTTPEVGRAFTAGSAGYWLQLGAFGRMEGAQALQHGLSRDWGWLAPLLAVFSERGVHRVQAGPYASREQAREVMARLRAGGGPAGILVERR